jgi:hypothetical protein
MAVWRCRRCAVIPSSTFTAAAIQTANALGCQLIDGHQIQALIRRHLTL